MFAVNGASFIRKSSPALNRDGGLKLLPVYGARKWSRGLRSQLNQVSVFACLHKRPIHRLNYNLLPFAFMPSRSPCAIRVKYPMRRMVRTRAGNLHKLS